MTEKKLLPSAAPSSASAAAQLQLESIGAGGSEQELEQQILLLSKRARHLAGEVVKGNATIQAKDARIAELEQQLAARPRPGERSKR